MKKEKILALILVVCFGLTAFVGCEKTPQVSTTNTPAVETEPPYTVAPTSTPLSESLKAWKYEFIKGENNLEYTYTQQDTYVPFWLGNVMYNESFCFINDGTKTQAKLLLTPKKILSVRDWSLKIEYQEGVDYSYDANTKTLNWLEGSSIPYFTLNDLAGKDENGNLIQAWGGPGWDEKNPWDEKGRSRFNNALYCVGEFLYAKQCSITYTYETSEFQGPVNPYQGERLPKIMAKLNAGEPLDVVCWGDSILYGCDASSMYKREPMLPTYPKIFEKALEDLYKSKVTLRNYAVGGMTSQWGVDNLEDKVIKKAPDLVIILFGGNDGGIGGAKTTIKNVKSMVDTIKEKLPDCEIILMGTIVANKDSGFENPQLQRLLTAGFNTLAGEGVAVVDIYNLHSYILQSKNYVDCTGNNINHPNDFLIRIHAMQLLSTVVDFNTIRANNT